MPKNLELLKDLIREFDGDAFIDSSGNLPPPWKVEFAFSFSRDERAELRPSGDPEDTASDDRWDTGLRTLRIYRDDESLCVADDAIAKAAKSPNSTKELASVSHELGHHYWWIGRKMPRHPRSRPYKIQYEEEVLAWAIGRNILAVRDFEEWKLFDEEQDRSLETYRDGFGLSREEAEKIAADILVRQAELIDRSRSWPEPRCGHP